MTFQTYQRGNNCNEWLGKEGGQKGRGSGQLRTVTSILQPILTNLLQIVAPKLTP